MLTFGCLSRVPRSLYAAGVCDGRRRPPSRGTTRIRPATWFSLPIGSEISSGQPLVRARGNISRDGQRRTPTSIGSDLRDRHVEGLPPSRGVGPTWEAFDATCLADVLPDRRRPRPPSQYAASTRRRRRQGEVWTLVPRWNQASSARSHTPIREPAGPRSTPTSTRSATE